MLPWIRKIKPSGKTVVSMVFVVAADFVFLSWPAAPAQAQADTFGVEPVAKVIQLGSDDLRVIIARIIRAALGLLGVIAVGIILYAGFLIMTSGGSEEKVLTGKRILINATIGLAIILSAFGIVQFVLKNLQDAILGPSGEEDAGVGGKPAFSTFAGSGALGSIIKFHYPTPNQTDVPRNTKIAVTFAEPVAPGSFIKNSNNTCWPKDGGVKSVAIAKDACLTFTEGALTGEPVPYYGDCLDLNGDQGISWETECDRLATSTIQIYQTQFATSTPKPVYEAAALAVYDADKTAATFTFRPLMLLGDSVKDVWHTVRLLGGTSKTAGIKRLDGSDIFPSNKLTKYYEWQFETNTTVDFTPPHVSDTYPSSGGTVPRNSIVQVTFSEPMDPSTAQGLVGAVGSGGANLVFNSPAISGEWKITNVYKTAEFLSSQACGQNSCGEIMYCLPVDCPAGDETCATKYTGLVRTAALLDAAAKNFVAVPFTGLTDMAGNALDSGPGGVADGVLAKPHKPSVADPAVAGAGELAPDNFWWNFSVENTIDRIAPYLSKVTPGIDAEGVKGLAPVTIEFSRPMWQSTLVSGVKLEEYPAGVQGLDSLPFYHDFGIGAQGQTVAQVKPGRPFGPNGLDLYYFATVSSSVRSANQNCLYPGRGPTGVKGSTPTCVYEEDKNGVPVKDISCVPVKFEPASDTGCVTATALNQTEADVAACVEKIKGVSPI